MKKFFVMLMFIVGCIVAGAYTAIPFQVFGLGDPTLLFSGLYFCFFLYAKRKGWVGLRGSGILGTFGMMDLSFPDQVENPAGLVQVGWWIPIVDLDTEAVMLPFDQITNNTEATTIQGDHVPASGKCFFELYATMDTVGIMNKLVGELDGKSWTHEIELFHPTLNEDVAALARKIPNTRALMIFETVDGKRIQVGSSKFPAVVSDADLNTGKATADRRGLNLKMISRGVGPAPFYTGVIQLSASVVPATSS